MMSPHNLEITSNVPWVGGDSLKGGDGGNNDIALRAQYEQVWCWALLACMHKHNAMSTMQHMGCDCGTQHKVDMPHMEGTNKVGAHRQTEQQTWVMRENEDLAHQGYVIASIWDKKGIIMHGPPKHILMG